MANQTVSKEKKTGYFRGVRSELKKVTWPSKKELVNYTLVVIFMCFFSAVAIGLMDLVFKQAFRLFA